MIAWLDRLGATLLDASLAAIAITGLVVLAILQCRQPARRRLWARAGLVATLTLLPLAALNPVPRIDLQWPIRSLLMEDPSEGFADLEPRPELPSPQGKAASGPDRPDQDSDHRSLVRRVGRILLIAYLAGLSMGLGYIGVGIWGLVLLIRRAWPASASSQELYESLPASGRFSKPRLLVSPLVTRPVLVGPFRPFLLIPPGFDDASAMGRLRLSLLHELAHFEDLDHWYSTMATIAQAVWFFLPTSWWIRDQMKLDQEFLADRRAVASFGTTGDYASSLVELASLNSSDRPGTLALSPSPAPIVVPGVASSLVLRVQMLLKCPFPIEGTTPVWWRWSTALTLALATLATSCLTIRGLGEWWEWHPATRSGNSRSFELPELVIEPRENQGRSFELHYRLPEEFTLNLEIMADPGDLKLIEILGHSLKTEMPDEIGRQDDQLWHRVRIRRTGGFDLVEVDDQPLSPSPLEKNRSPWLTIRPFIDRTTRIREIALSW